MERDHGSIRPYILELAHQYIMETWVWYFDYEKWSVAALRETLFWYAATGQAIGHETTTERWMRAIKLRRTHSLPRPARKRWKGILETTPRLRGLAPSPLGWFTDNGNATDAWRQLQEIAYVGPKIASWVLRDLSFLRDYSDDVAHRVKYHYNNRDSSWFRKLPTDQQALFVPLDRWVIRGAKRRGALPNSARIAAIQGNEERYRAAAERIVRWAKQQKLDPRDVDVYLYLEGIFGLWRHKRRP